VLGNVDVYGATLVGINVVTVIVPEGSPIMTWAGIVPTWGIVDVYAGLLLGMTVVIVTVLDCTPITT
jgi:hypothetical protein